MVGKGGGGLDGLALTYLRTCFTVIAAAADAAIRGRLAKLCTNQACMIHICAVHISSAINDW